MKIQLHEKAVKYFNEKSAEFLCELKPDTTKRRERVKVESSASHCFISDHLTDKDIINITSLGYVDNLSGKQVARFFLVDKTPIGLNQDSYSAFLKFAEDFHHRKEINTLLSLEFIIESIFDWFENKYKGLIPKDKELVEYIAEKSEKEIKKYKISIPISFIAIEKPFVIGKINFEYFETGFYDKFINTLKSKAQESKEFDENNFSIFEKDFRKKYQGAVFASISLEAEQQRCIEIAMSEAEKALMALRFFSPSTFLPQIPCYFGIMGQTEIPKNHVFIFENEIPTVKEGMEEKRMYSWPISVIEFSEIYKAGLGIASKLISQKDTTAFENSVLNSMSLFGRALTSRNFQDKIVYSLVSIETLLLQKSN